MILRVITLFLMLVSAVSYAFEKCPVGATYCDNTALGKLEYIWGQGEKDNQSRILLNGKEIFKNDSGQIGSAFAGVHDGVYYDSKNLVSKIVVYYDLNTPQYIRTNPRYGDIYLYTAYRLFDFSGKEVVISNEFYPYEIWNVKVDWISWGQKNSVIAFEDGSRFRYEKGHITMIERSGWGTSENKQ